MSYFKLLPIPLLLLSTMSHLAYAEPLNLPSMSVEGFSGEETPYALPSITLSTPDAGEMIKRLPGANINSNGPLTSIVQYRGLFGDRVNVLIDGVRINQAGPNRMDSPLSYLPASRVADVAIYRGIAPVRSGIETMGGTVIANSKQAEFGTDEAFETHGNLTAGYADNGNTRNAGITTDVANKTHRFQVSGSLDRGDDLDFDNGTISPSEHERDTLGITYGFQKARNEVEFAVVHDNTGHTGTPALPMDIEYARGENYNFNFAKELNNGGKVTTGLHYQDSEHKMSNYLFRTTASAMQRHAIADVEASSINLSYNLNSWTVGFDADQADHNTDIFNPNASMFYVNNFNDVERDRYSVFAEWEGKIQTDLKLQSGVRLSRVNMDAGEVDSSMTSLSGMMAMMGANTTTLRDNFNASDRSQEDNLVDLTFVLTKTLNQDVDIEFGLARKQRAASYQERYLWLPMQSTSGLADGNNHLGNINLDAETAYQAELGLDWHTAKAGISPRVFYHHINDYIQGVAIPTSNMAAIAVSTMMGGDTTPLQYQNVDAKLYGMDANWFATLSDEWQLNGTVSYVRGERRDTNDSLYRIAPLTARTMLSYVQTNWRLGVEVETVASQNKVSTENEEQKTSGYTVFNLMGNYEATKALTLSAGVNNVFDRNYQDHLGGYNRISINDNPDIAQGERLPGLGRSVYAGVNFNW
jgi:iron complex outermembrane receptor protein